MNSRRIITVTLILLANVSVGQDADSIRENTILELYQSIREQIDESKEETVDPFAMEIDQLIINETVSKVGQDFQDMFYSRWIWPPGMNHRFIILISERPIFGNSTQIEISVNEIQVYAGFLQPRYDVVESMCTQGMSVCMQYMVNYDDVLKQLEGDDMTGTGIY